MKNKFIYRFFIVTLLISIGGTRGGAFAQSRAIDSLQGFIMTAKEDTTKVKAINNLCRQKINYGAYLQADSLAREAVKIASKINYKFGLASSYSTIAGIGIYQGNYTEALKNQFASLKILEEIGDKKGIANSYNNIGLIYRHQGNYPEALKNQFTSLKIREEIKDKAGVGASYNNIGVIYMKEGNNSEALKNYWASLKIKEEMGDKRGIADSYGNIGQIYARQGNNTEALKSYFSALKMHETLGYKHGISTDYINIGELFTRQNKLADAREYINKALTLSREIGNKDRIKDGYRSFSVLDSITGNYKSAFENYKMYIVYRDSLFNEEDIKKTVQAQMNFDFEKTQERDKLVQEKKDAVQHEEVRRQKVMRYSFTIAFVLMLLLAVSIFRSNRQKQKANQELAKKNELIEIQKLEVERQKGLLEEKNINITDSINYAKRIQSSFLTSENYISQRLSDYFILFSPRDIVSGDFYWIMEKHSSLYVCTADCTGHGIPGAFMSLIGMGILNEIIYSKSHLKQTDEIINELRRIIILAVNPEGVAFEGKDGMDLVLCRYDFQKMELEYTGANNSFYIVRSGKLIELKPDKMPVGKYVGDEQTFTRKIIPLEKGDCIYTFSDGYADQFGGSTGKKFKSKRLKELLLANCHKPMIRQKVILNTTINEWKGNLEQVDDITVIGIRI